MFSSKELAYLANNMICDVGVVRVKEVVAWLPWLFSRIEPL